MNFIPPSRILRLPAVLERYSLSRSSLYARIKQGLWPPAVSLGGRASGWPENEVEAVLSAFIAGKSNDKVRQLVAELYDARKGGV